MERRGKHVERKKLNYSDNVCPRDILSTVNLEKIRPTLNTNLRNENSKITPPETWKGVIDF